jgi:hypothetical protein
MTDIVIQTKSGGVAVNGLTDPPEITILRLDTDVAVVTGAAMSDQAAGGLYKFAFLPIAGVHYSFSVDADPNVIDQVDDRSYFGAFNNESNDVWRDRGLDPGTAKTVDDNGIADDADIDEDVAADADSPAIHKDVLTAGNVTTVTRA